MATAKKKSTPVKKTVAKKPAAKKAPAKKSSKAAAAPVSFRVQKDEPAFLTVKFTRQTIYWLILLGFIAIAFLWILKLQIDVYEITSSIGL